MDDYGRDTDHIELVSGVDLAFCEMTCAAKAFKYLVLVGTEGGSLCVFNHQDLIKDKPFHDFKKPLGKIYLQEQICDICVVSRRSPYIFVGLKSGTICTL